MAIKLSRAALRLIPKSVAVPRYESRDLKAGILHVGVGNFHRAHQAVYLDDLFNLGCDWNWAIAGAGVRNADEEMRRHLLAQDALTTVVEVDATHVAPRITGSMIEFLRVGHPRGILDRLKDPAIRIVSLTITEGGYFIDPASGEFDTRHPQIVSDVSNIAAPCTVFGLILVGLMARRESGDPPFTVLSCDNLPNNGIVTRNAVVGIARLVEPALAAWIEANVAFPNSMVDRITPVTTSDQQTFLQNHFGIMDHRPVFCEPFRQWVVEDLFPSGRPALEHVGVQFVPDVAPFEMMKIRILNGGHATIAYPAALLGIEFVDEAVQEPLINRFLQAVLHDEILPTVPPVPGTDLLAYTTSVGRRFANSFVRDTTRRLCADGSNRQPKFILPTVSDRLAKRLNVDGLALVGALWCRYCYGETEKGHLIASNDANWCQLRDRARAARHEPTKWLEMRNIFGDLASSVPYSDAFSRSLRDIWDNGTRGALKHYLDARTSKD